MIILNSIIARGANNDPYEVKEVQRLLNKANKARLAIDGIYGMHSEAEAIMFQRANGLKPDGMVGPITWSLLSRDAAGLANNRRSTTTSGTRELMVRTSENYVGVREVTENNSPTIKKWLADVGIHYPAPWCMAFVYHCIKQAHELNGFKDDMKRIPKTAGVLDFWNRCPESWRVDKMNAQRGDIMIMDFGGGKGHTGIVDGYRDGYYETNEGNTDDAGSREGDAVANKRRSKYNSPLIKGFIRVPDPGAAVAS